MFKRPTDPPEYTHLFAVPALAIPAAYLGALAYAPALALDATALHDTACVRRRRRRWRDAGAVIHCVACAEPRNGGNAVGGGATVWERVGSRSREWALPHARSL